MELPNLVVNFVFASTRIVSAVDEETEQKVGSFALMIAAGPYVRCLAASTDDRWLL